MEEIVFQLREELKQKKIQVTFNQDSEKIYIFVNRFAKAIVDVDLNDMQKTAQNFD
jgi:hypothetical protein